MSIERKRRVLELLEEALEVPADERPAFLEARCDDDEMRREVESLLATDPTDPVLEAPAFNVHDRDAAIGRRIGDYRIVELLGRGGMGAVYLAEREDFDQRVALKLLRRGLDFDDVLVRRFHNERQILAHLDHPHIARLFDGGTTDDLVPYFVMEHVEGVPIDRYCEREELPVEERLELFRKVCSAVEFAHRSLVVHRDLKPGNVLITAGGEPKLLDFGIAKVLESGLSAHTLATATGHGPMTPRYASPEQIRLEPITTASDVYSLGVLLYELLTGRTPYRLASDRSDEVARAVCEQEPEKPSTAVRRAAGAGDDTILDPRRLGQLLSGDLDSIVLKALRKKPENRYGSVEQLSEDLRRYLEGEPVTAREGTGLYRFGKFVRRNRLALSVVAAFLLLSSGFGVVSMVLRQEAVSAYVEAEKERERAEKMVEFLQELFGGAGPDASKGRDLSARDLLSRGTEKVPEFKDDPEFQIRLLGTLGRLFRDLGDLDAARDLMEQSLAIARQFHDGDHDEVATRLVNLAVVLNDQSQHPEAETLLREALEMRKRLEQPEIEILRNESNLAATLTLVGGYEEAEQIYRRIHEFRLRHNEPDDGDVATSHRNLGGAYLATGKLDQAAEHLEEALRIRVRPHGEMHTGVASVLDVYGRVRAAQGDRTAARADLERALAIRTRLLKVDHRLVARSRTHLGELLIDEDPARAEELLEQAIASLERTLPQGRELADARSVLGELRTKRGLFEEAEPLLLESHRRLWEIQTSRSLATRSARRRVLGLYERWNRPEASERFRREYPAPDPVAPDRAPDAQGSETDRESR